MAVDSPLALLDALRELQLLDSAQLDETAALLAQFPDAKLFTAELVRRGWITAFQAEQLVEGQVHKLTLGPYLLLEVLGEGGMGQVFKALNRLMKRVVALKVIRQERLPQGDAIRRFQREIQALAQLAHPNIVTAYHADQVGDCYFLVMEYVEGTDLHRLVKEEGPLAAGRACEYVRQAAVGLEHAHERGLVHRDIKPANLLLSRREGVIKVLDLGLARIACGSEDSAASSATSVPGMIMGTPDFMAPEQAVRAHEADIRADIYSLGCTLYFLVTGRPPFAKGSDVEKLVLHQQAEPVAVELLRRDLPEELPQVLRRMMAKRPEDRYQTPAEVATALTPLCRTDNENPGRTIDAGPPGVAAETVLSTPLLNTDAGRSAGPVARSWRTRRLPVAGAVFALIVAASVGLVAYNLRPADTQGPPPPPSALIVAANGEGQYTSIAEAIAGARGKMRILVRPGRYRESLVIDKEVELVGDGNAGEVVVESTDAPCLEIKAESASVRRLALRSQVGPKGDKQPAIHIVHGRATIEDCDITSAAYSGVVIHESTANPTLRRCTIHHCASPGIYVHRSAQGTIEDCDIFSNKVGLMIRAKANPLIRRCKIRDNQSCGMFVFEQGEATLDDNTVISGNDTQGLWVKEDGSSATLQRCTIQDNKWCGVFINQGARAKLYDCSILANGEGGLLLSDKGTSAVIEWCKVNRNKFPGGISVLGHATARVEDCDVRDNSGGAWKIEEPRDVTRKNNKE
jgi:parallel beta-helix repeat protein